MTGTINRLTIAARDARRDVSSRDRMSGADARGTVLSTVFELSAVAGDRRRASHFRRHRRSRRHWYENAFAQGQLDDARRMLVAMVEQQDIIDRIRVFDGDLHAVLVSAIRAGAVRGAAAHGPARRARPGSRPSNDIAERLASARRDLQTETERVDIISSRRGLLRALPADDRSRTDLTAITVERIFDPYFTTKPPGDGTCLGCHLPQDRRRARRRSRGRLFDGGGTTFACWIPAAKPDG